MLSRSLLTGVTQLELLICIACLGILAVLVVPGYTAFLHKHQLQSVAEALAADLRWARSEALKQNTEITVTFSPGPAATWHYVIQTTRAPVTVLKTVNSTQQAAFSSVAVEDNFRKHATSFDPSRGLSEGNNGTLTLTSASGQYRLKVILGNLGRVRICADQSDNLGYAVCS